RCPEGAGGRGALGRRQPGDRARAVQGGRHQLPIAAQRPGDLSAGAGQPGAGAGGALRRHRRAVPGARRWLVEPVRSRRRRGLRTLGRVTMVKRMAIMLILVAVVFGGIFGFQAFKANDAIAFSIIFALKAWKPKMPPKTIEKA